MAHLKLVGHQRFTSPHIEEDVVLKGGIIEVDAGMAAKLLDAKTRDIANNQHPVWVDVSDEYATEAPDPAPEAAKPAVAVAKPVAKPAPKRRSAAKKPAAK